MLHFLWIDEANQPAQWSELCPPIPTPVDWLNETRLGSLELASQIARLSSPMTHRQGKWPVVLHIFKRRYLSVPRNREGKPETHWNPIVKY
uniref:Uncharacterized protein n=1 Tax=Sphaerodactylus townsendi TaxID=933632 RepID=A0ACB8FNC8_9SAUR